MNINEIKNEGFFINKVKPKIESIAFLSLRISLESYFSTYKSCKSNFGFLTDSNLSKKEIDDLYSIKYIENACESISHFQQFVELTIKDILSKKHILLSIDASKKHELFYNILFNGDVSQEEIESTRQLEFTEALNRIVDLINKNKLSKEVYGFIAEAKEWLNILNYLRNRIAHRGVYILRYKALDLLFGKYAFPFMEKILELEEYKGRANWRFKANGLKINPIHEIIKHFNNENYSIYKVSLLKEIGRSSFENPLFLGSAFLKSLNNEIIKRSESFAKNVSKFENVEDAVICPICKTKSLVKFHDFYDDTDLETGITNEAFLYVYNVKCFCCTFEIDSSMHGIEKMGLGLENYWEIK